MRRRFIVSALGLVTGLALFVSPAAAASLSLTVYTPPMTPAGSLVTVKAKATPGAYCAISITHVLSYGYRKYANRYGAVSWTPRVPSGTPGGYHQIKVSCIKGGQRVTRYSTLVVTRTYYFDGYGDATVTTEELRIPGGFTVTLYVEYGYLSAEWQNASSSRYDFFHVGSPSGPGSYRRSSAEGGTYGWFNIDAYGDPVYWRLTVSGVAE
jgi:hypothetical protein